MIERSTHENIRLLRMAHGKANALDLEFLHGLTAAIKEEQQGPERALILTGTGKIFSAGVDLNRVLEGRTYLRDFLPALDALIEALIGFDKP
ncbi:MAG: enoyl-CoA hydratase-related protein [Planctomycetota bacterium]